jgi:hypothetical protein
VKVRRKSMKNRKERRKRELADNEGKWRKGKERKA